MSNAAGSTFFESPLLFVQHFSLRFGSCRRQPSHPSRDSIRRAQIPQNFWWAGIFERGEKQHVSVRRRPFKSKSFVIVNSGQGKIFTEAKPEVVVHIHSIAIHSHKFQTKYVIQATRGTSMLVWNVDVLMSSSSSYCFSFSLLSHLLVLLYRSFH